ncbi:MAG: DNA-binding protein [Candidatus Omnitrophota bacterium]
MNRKIVYSLQFTVYSLFFLLISICYAQTVSSEELINNTKEYDGKKIVYSGEVIGDIMDRGDHAWVNLSDGKNALGIWAGKLLLNKQDILYTGGYKSIGAELEIEGIFHRSCLDHGGDLDIHAISIRKLSNGRIVRHEIDPLKKKIVFILSGVLCLVLILIQLKRRLIPKQPL